MSRNHTPWSAAKRALQLVRKSGPFKTFFVGVSVVDDRYFHCFDRKYGVWARGPFALKDSSFPQGKLKNATRYDPTNAWAFRWVLRKLNLPKSYRFADFGCGLGRT